MPNQITKTSKGLKVLAPAKLNLSLLVAGKRPDGFHELETIMAKIDLFDELTIEPGLKDGIEVICQGRQWAPQGRDNLVYKAVERLLEISGRAESIKITLDKNIPAGGGLGSASTDAAAALIGVNELLGLGVNSGELKELAVELGSDVAFFLGKPLSICRGRGEKIEKIEQNFDFSAILILPNVNSSTVEVYKNYCHDEGQYKALKSKIDEHINKNRIDLVVQMCANMLQNSCFELYEELTKIKAQVESMGIKPLCLSGSGSTMYYVLKTNRGAAESDYPERIRNITECDTAIISNIRW